MKAQAKGLAREYDRVCDELQEWFLIYFNHYLYLSQSAASSKFSFNAYAENNNRFIIYFLTLARPKSSPYR